MNRLMRVTLPTFVVSLVVWGLVAVWDADPRALTSWMLTWQRIAVYVATVSQAESRRRHSEGSVAASEAKVVAG